MSIPKRSSLGLLLIVLLLSTAAPWPSMGQEPVQAPLSDTNEAVSDGQSSHDQQDRTDGVEQGLSQSGDLQEENIPIGQSALVGQAQGVNEQPGTEGNLQEVNESDENASDAGEKSVPRYEKMTARSTFFMAIFAGFGLLVSGIATYFLVRTFEVTRDAAKAAQVSAAAAEAVIKQDRAEVALIDMDWSVSDQRYEDGETSGNLTIRWEAKNYGKSIAFDVAHFFSVQGVEYVLTPDSEPPKLRQPSFKGFIKNLLPGGPGEDVRCIVPLKEIIAIFQTGRVALVRARVIYVDKYGVDRRTEAACQVRPAPREIQSSHWIRNGILPEIVVDFRLQGANRSD